MHAEEQSLLSGYVLGNSRAVFFLCPQAFCAAVMKSSDMPIRDMAIEILHLLFQLKECPEFCHDGTVSSEADKEFMSIELLELLLSNR